MNLGDDGYPAQVQECETLSDSPHVKLWRNFLSPYECGLIAQSVQDILEPSMVADPRTGQVIAHPIRTSSAAPIGPTRESLPIQAILRRIAAATRTDVRQGESLTVLHYAPGQQYRMHMDALPHVANQRIATVILYLNEGYAGGETIFEANGLTIAGKGGDALYFENVTPEGAPDPASRHAGLPVRQGAKWVATRWIRARPFDVWQGPDAAV
jgi:prolyl 4-hydroxylase